MTTITQALIDQLIRLSQQASDAILAVYHSDKALSVDTKQDSSPVTEADIAAHHVLVAGLEHLLPDTPVLSEESDIAPYHERKRWSRYWLIDPLDGTKEFIGRNGEFTVNIALIERNEAVLGVVAVPVSQTIYYGAKGVGAYKINQEQINEGQAPQVIRVRDMAERLKQQQAIEVVASRRHGGEAMSQLKERLEQQFPTLDYKSMGSSLKLCLIAEGEADLYPRLAPTSEWDTAAAHAVVVAAGGEVLDEQLSPLRYNTKESLLNPFFYVVADKAYPWSQLLNDVQEIVRNEV